MKRILLLVGFLYALVCSGQQIPLSNFKDSILPAFGAGDLYDLTQPSTNCFQVVKDGDSVVVVRKVDRKYFGKGECSELVVDGDTLVAINIGEFGGWLTIRRQGMMEEDTINIRHASWLFVCDSTIYALGGLAHMGSHYGSLWQITPDEDSVRYEEVADLQYPPDGYSVCGDSVLITHKGGLYVFADDTMTFMCAAPQGCNSIELDKHNVLWFGLNNCYVTLDLLTSEMKYHVYIGDN